MVEGTNIPAGLALLYPFRPQEWVTPGGACMRYLDEGPREDTVVLMLHGNPTWSFYFRDLVRDLSSGRRCLVPDHIGMGLSEKPQDYPYTLETRIRDVEALMEHLGVRRIDLVVHDWGGAIGFGVARRMPERIGRLVILNTAAFPASRIPWRIKICRWPGLGPLLVRGANGFARAATRMAMRRRKLTAWERAGYLLPYDSWSHRVAVSAFVRDIPMEATHPSRKTLDAIAAGLSQFRGRPVLIVWGGRDFCFDDGFLAEWRRILPEAEVRRIADAGHYVLEDGGEEARNPIAAFLDRNGESK